jgi:hypothetical protein
MNQMSMVEMGWTLTVQKVASRDRFTSGKCPAGKAPKRYKPPPCPPLICHSERSEESSITTASGIVLDDWCVGASLDDARPQGCAAAGPGVGKQRPYW